MRMMQNCELTCEKYVEITNGAKNKTDKMEIKTANGNKNYNRHKTNIKSDSHHIYASKMKIRTHRSPLEMKCGMKQQ